MSTVDTWDPSQQGDTPGIDKEVLLQLAQISADGKLDQLQQTLSSEQINAHRHLMKHHKEDWLSSAANLEPDTLVHLVRFFTLAEMQLPGWEAGSKSPVVWLCRELKNRGAFPDAELIAWIKSNTDNKFLPYGNILDL
ncbi:MAG: hypothetical protein R3E62_06480 [Pseudomonadales bacterium]|jgi:hypothetical protein